MERRTLRTGTVPSSATRTVERRLQTKRPPGTGWRGADGGVLLSECGLMGGMRGGADFAVNFGEVGVCDELLEHGVCGVDGVDGLGCE